MADTFLRQVASLQEPWKQKSGRANSIIKMRSPSESADIFMAVIPSPCPERISSVYHRVLLPHGQLIMANTHFGNDKYDAASSEHDVIFSLQTESKQSAAHILMEEVNSARQYYDPAGFASYEQDLAGRLQKDGVIPDLSLGWAKLNMDKLADSTGAMTQKELQRLENFSNEQSDPVTNAMLKSLESNLPQLEKEAGTRNEGLTGEDLDCIFRRRQIESEQAFMSNLQSIHTLPLVKTLFSNNKHLLNALEKLHSDRTGLTRWQRIKGVLDASETVFNDETANVFLNKVKTEPQYASQFSKEEIDAVKELHQNWNTPDVQRLTSKSDFELTGSIDEWSLSDIVTQGKFELPEAPFKSWLQTGDPFADHKYKMIGID